MLGKILPRRRKALFLSILILTAPMPAMAQVVFAPPNCNFQTVFVIAPDVKDTVMLDDQGLPQKSTIANLGVILDGKPNFFRAECMPADVPAQLDEKLMLDDMNTIAMGNNLRNPHAWVEKSDTSLIGRVRGELTDTEATYVIDIHRFVGKHSLFDVWIGSPPGTFPSEGNLVFLKEIKLDGKRIY